MINEESTWARMAAVVTTPGGTASFTFEGAAHSSRVVNGADAAYQDVVSGITASYTVLPEALKENLVIAKQS